MNKTELIQKISQDTGLTKIDTVRAVKALVASIRETVGKGGRISLTGLGTFKVKPRKARPGRNPKTGEPLSIPAGRKISFKPSFSLKKLIKEG